MANTEFQRVITMIGHLATTSEENAAAMEEISSSISEENKMLKFIASSAKELDGLDGELQLQVLVAEKFS